MVITLAWHARGREFEPARRRKFYVLIYFFNRITEEKVKLLFNFSVFELPQKYNIIEKKDGYQSMFFSWLIRKLFIPLHCNSQLRPLYTANKSRQQNKSRQHNKQQSKQQNMVWHRWNNKQKTCLFQSGFWLNIFYCKFTQVLLLCNG